MTLTPQIRRAAVRHLRQADPVLAKVISKAGPFDLKPQRRRFEMLVKSIVSQQISVAAARTIFRRLRELVAPKRPGAEHLVKLSVDQLRAVGVSRQKATYLLDLAHKTVDRQIHFGRFPRMDDQAVIDELTAVKGIGRWTAEMFLIFSLGRLDVLPCDDLGVRSAIRSLYALDELPNRAQIEQLAQPWRPYASVASWYCWRSLDS